MRVYEISVSADGLPKKIVLSPRAADPKTNWLSILIGENGTRKSLLLRLLVGGALKRPPLRSRRHNSAEAALDCFEVPNKVFAISGTHSDRFPVVSGIPIRRMFTTFDIDSFSYFGPRYAGNVATRQRMITTLAYSILCNSDRFQQRQESVKAILDRLGYKGIIYLSLSFNEKQILIGEKDSRRNVLLKLSVDLERKLAVRKDSSHSKLRAFVQLLAENGPELSAVLELTEKPYTLVFDLQSGISGIESVQQLNQLTLMIATGILRVDDLMFCRKLDTGEPGKENEWVDSDDLSSGQWQLLNGLLNLALNVEDGSFVLIDEPENSCILSGRGSTLSCFALQ